MKKLILFIVIMIAARSKAQTIPGSQVISPNTNTVQTNYNFYNLDNFQVYSAIVTLIKTISSGTTSSNISDNSADTLNARLKVIANLALKIKLDNDSLKDFTSGRQSGFHLTYSSGTITPGIVAFNDTKSITIYTSPDFVGSFNGTARGANQIITVNANTGGLLTNITAVVNAGSFTYDWIH